MPRVRILIRNKEGVFDPEGKVIHGGLKRLGHEDISNVRVGKLIDIVIDETNPEAVHAKVEQMCKAFLVNPVMEDFSFRVLADDE